MSGEYCDEYEVYNRTDHQKRYKFHVQQSQAQIEIYWRFTWRLPDIHLTFTWHSPDHLTILWPSPDPHQTFT